MKTILLSMGCALVAPLLFAQVSTTTTETTTSSQPAVTQETTTYTTGVVSSYEPSKTIVVKDEHGGPVRFALGTAARVMDGAGKIVTAPLRSGQKVRVYYNGTGETRTVDHVVVED